MYSKGIYIIFNMKTEDFYIGSTKVSFSRRLTQHLSDLYKKRHRNIHLQRAYDKYGWESFYFAIVEAVEEADCIQKEQWYLDNWKPRYNIAKFAEGSAKGRKLTSEQIKKIRDVHLGRVAWNRGVRFSKESRERMAAAKRGKPSPIRGISTQKINRVMRSDGAIYDNPKQAAEVLGIKPNTIIKAISDKSIKRKVRGYYFEYLPKEDNVMEGIRKCQRGYSVYFKNTYLGYKTDLEEAKTLRDNYLKTIDNPIPEDVE